MAGPLIVGAVALASDKSAYSAVQDSKQLSLEKRQKLYSKIIEQADFIGIGWATAAEIDRLGVTQALRLAGARALRTLTTEEHELILDGSHNFLKESHVKTVVGGDALHPEISAASIVAKVLRDRYMSELNQENFSFSSHKGYGTKKHYQELDTSGPSLHHRELFLRSWRNDQD